MKIAIIGAHCVGKTTLAEKLREHLKDYNLRIEPYYELEELGYVFSEIPDVGDFIEQLKYSIKQISESDDNVIFDRCPIDILAYIKALNRFENIQLLYDKVESTIDEIDLIVFVPIEEPDVIDCQDYPELRHDVNEILNDSISGFDFGIETVKVKGNLSDRTNQVLDKISSIM